MDQTTDKSWDNWAANSLNESASRLLAECVVVEEHIHLFPNGRDKMKIVDLLHEMENRATWIKQLAMRQMLEDLKRKV